MRFFKEIPERLIVATGPPCGGQPCNDCKECRTCIDCVCESAETGEGVDVLEAVEKWRTEK